MNIQAITTESCIVRNTASKHGRTIGGRARQNGGEAISITAASFCDAGDEPLRFDTHDRETEPDRPQRLRPDRKPKGIVVPLGRYDAIYVPRDASIEVTPGPAGCDLAEIAAPVANAIPSSSSRSATCRRIRGCTSRPAGRQPARAEHPDRQERRGRPDHGGRHLQRAGQLDVVAAARARGDARGGLSLHRHAGARVRRAARLHRHDGTRARDHRPRRATSC